MKLHDLRPAAGSRRPGKRVGRGHGSGKGKTAGRGTKGQKARGTIQPWFEGGQTPLHIRTPKLHGFKNRFRVEYLVVNVGELAAVPKGTLVTPDTLRHDRVVPDRKSRPMPIKILGQGEAPSGVTIHAHAFSRAALDKLEAAGSTAQRLSWPDGEPIEMTEPEVVAEAEPSSEAIPEAAASSEADAEPEADAQPESEGADDSEAER